MDNLNEYEERGWELLNEKPVLECDEVEFEKHCEENEQVLQKMEDKADTENGLWVVKRFFIDFYHKRSKNRYYFIDPHGLQDLIETADLKNGMDTAVSVDKESFLLIANGQGYATLDGDGGIVTTVFECKLLYGKKAKGIKEILEITERYDGEQKAEEIEAARAFYGDCLPL